MVSNGKNGVISLAGGKFSNEVYCDCSKWEVHVLGRDGIYWYFWFVGSWFGGLAYSTSFYVVDYVCFDIWPPVVFVDSIGGSLYSGVSCGIGVVIEGEHPPSKFIVFQDDKLQMSVV